MPRQIQGAQRDFSFGEIDSDLKRADDHPARKAGLRQMANMRIHNSGVIESRSGRSALFPATTLLRIEELTISPGNIYKIGFGPGLLQIINSAGAVVGSFTLQGNNNPLPWTANNINDIVYASLGLSIYITLAGMQPQVVTWNGVSTWSIAAYNELIVGNQKRTPFYRISPQGIAIQPAGQTGSVNITATDAVFTPAHIGTRIRFVGRQILITNYTSPFTVTGFCEEPLPGSQQINFASAASLVFSLGDVVIGGTTGSKGIVTVITGNQIAVQLITNNTSSSTYFTYAIGGGLVPVTTTTAFTSPEVVAGPGGSLPITSTSAILPPSSVSVWDDEVFNAMRGYPASCFVDNFRLGFCNFPSVPNGISWSAINSPLDMFVSTLPSGGMFEVAPDKVQIFYVMGGAESSEFVFCDHKLYYIKIDASNPLKPGSVGFQTLSSDGCAQVQPRATQEVIIYANAGRSSVLAIVAPGAYYRPFNTKNLTDFHSNLFNNIKAIAVPTADGQFNERYAYVLNGDGSMAVGKYSLSDGQIVPTIGWGPWSGGGAVKWVAAWNSDVLFTTGYFGTTICEQLDDTRYLDAVLPVNALPAAFTPPGGKGPLWWIPSQSVTLMDQVTRPMGTYQIDANGFIIPQGNAGENLAAATLVAGQPWTETVEPFAPNAQPGADLQQRMMLRYVAQFGTAVVHNCGFKLAKLFSGKRTRTSPAAGTVMNFRRFEAYNQDDDPTLAPPVRETVESWRPSGGSFDPRVAVIKDVPGSLTIEEIDFEVSL